jgi:tetraacyldisaccharide 4'-kinase
MKTPRFWSTRNIYSTLLLPFSWVYFMGYFFRHMGKMPKPIEVPVLCIGNLTAGGSGKTPVALAVGELAKQQNIKAYFLTRGYLGKLRGPVLVDRAKHTAAAVGDEALLLAQCLPTIVGKNRAKAAKFAASQGAELIIMDDGFQNPRIHKTTSLVVVDRRLSFGNERMIPAGPLREPVMFGLARADGLVIINPATFMPTALPNIPVIIARTTPHNSMKALAGKRILAFCGIAYPQKFYDMLHECGAELAEVVSFADHHHFSEKDMEKLHAQAQALGAQLVTTAKDAARLSEAWLSTVTVAGMELNFEDAGTITTLLKKTIDDHAF